MVTWGSPENGGDSRAVQGQLRDVQHIYSAREAFAAVKLDGTVVTWGQSTHGGDSSAKREQLQEVEQIYSTTCAFAAVRYDGKVVTWGDSFCGGNSSSVKCVPAWMVRNFDL